MRAFVCVCPENANMLVQVEHAYCTTLVEALGCTYLTNESDVEFPTKTFIHTVKT